MAEDSELQDLWRRRDTLNQSEWTQLYRLIHRILLANRGKFALLKQLNEGIDIYIEDYFTRKVFEPARREGVDIDQPVYPGAICKYFERFLLDQWDEVQRRPGSRNDEPRQNPAGDEDFDIFELVGPEQIQAAWQPLDSEEQALLEAGLSMAAIEAAARAFIEQLAEHEQCLLKCHFAQRIPLSRLAGLVNNPHYAASRLGLAKDKARLPDYRDTRIGHWLVSSPQAHPPGLGLTLESHDRSVLFTILQILRHRALMDIDRDCQNGPVKNDGESE